MRLPIATSLRTPARTDGRFAPSCTRPALRGARIVHFTEGGAASGYAKSQIGDWQAVDWQLLREELEATAALARELALWVVLGSNHRLTPPHRPHNSLYVITDKGQLAGRYDKRLCSHAEISDWYTPGFAPLTFDVDGFRFGCALCIEIHFPEIFNDYRRRAVDCMLVSAYADDPIFLVEARAHASLNGYWFSMALPTNPRTPLASTIISPDGHLLAQTEPGRPSIAAMTIDPDDTRWHVPLRLARPWREQARAGKIYEALRADDERSRDRFSF